MLKCLSARQPSRTGFLALRRFASHFQVTSRPSSTKGLWLFCFLSCIGPPLLHLDVCRRPSSAPANQLILDGLVANPPPRPDGRFGEMCCTLYLVFKEPRLRQFRVELFGIPAPPAVSSEPALPASLSFRWRPSGEPSYFTAPFPACQLFFRFVVDFLAADRVSRGNRMDELETRKIEVARRL
jgi:hypothetical protein